MASILIAGARESDKDTVVELVRKIKTLPDFEFVDFDEVVSSDKKLLGELAAVGAFESLTKLKSWGLEPGQKTYGNVSSMVSRFYTLLEARLKEAQAASKNVLVSGYFSFTTQYGHVPLLSKDFLEYFRPDAVIVVESDAAGRFRILDQEHEVFLHDDRKIGEFKELVLQQSVARAYASAFAVMQGGLLKIITVRKGNVKQALKEAVETLTFVFK